MTRTSTPISGSLVDIEYYLPVDVVDNQFFHERYPEWDVKRTEKRTGVRQRRIVQQGETAYDLGLNATKKLLKKHPQLESEIDAILFCTQSPDYVMPSNAFLLHRDLVLSKNILALDFTLACSGYVYGLIIALSFITSGFARNVLLVTADTYSKMIDDDDRATRMLFGDGASASWIGQTVSGRSEPLIESFQDFKCATDGNGWDQFIVKAGGSRYPSSGMSARRESKIRMNGLRVLNLVSEGATTQVRQLLKENELNPDDIAQFFMHQGSQLALDTFSRNLKIGSSKMFSNLSSVGNTVSSSIPILVRDYFSQTSLPRGSRLLLCGFGVGFSWGSLLATK